MASLQHDFEPPDPIEEARIAMRVWSSEPPYGTSRHDVTLARTAAVHLHTLFARIEQLEAENARLKNSDPSLEKAISLQSTGMAIRAKESAVLVQMSPEDLQRVRDFGLRVFGTRVVFGIPLPEVESDDNGYENPGYRGAVSTNGQEVQD